MVELNIKLPKGYKATGEYREVQYGEYYYDTTERCAIVWTRNSESNHPYIILGKCAKQGDDLIGCLCGVADCFLSIAKERAENLTKIRVIDNYIPERDIYEDNSGVQWQYAYPVSLGNLKKLTNILLM